MANPVLGKSLCSDWFFLGQYFAVLTVSMIFLFWGEPGKFKICNQNSEKKKCEYCHSSHWNYQKKLKRLTFFRNFKDGWGRQTISSASYRKCILLSEIECHIMNNLLTELARALLGNIGPRSWIRQYSPVRPSRSVSKRLIFYIAMKT